MEVMASTKVANCRLAYATLLVFVAIPPAFGVEVEAGVQLGISRTDNALLTTSPNEVDDLVYRASPFLNYVHESPGLDAGLRYRYSWYRYDDLDASSSYHMGEGYLTGKFWQEAVAVEVGVRRRQVLREPTGTIPPGSLADSGNLLDRDEIYINPRLQRKLGRSVTVSMDYRLVEGSYDDSLIQDDTNQHGTFSMENYAAGSGFTWAVRYDWRRTEYEISSPWENQRAWAELGFWAGATTRLFVSAGNESPWDDPLKPSLEDSFWEAGLAYKPNENLIAEFAAGERSFGSSARGELEYSFRRGRTSFSYAETPTTTGFNQSNTRRSVLDPDELVDYLNTPGVAERFLSKRLQWNLEFEQRRSNLSLELFDEERSDRTSIDGTPAEDQDQRGVNASISWTAGSRTELYLAASLIRRQFANASRSDVYGVGIGANYQLGSRTQVSLDYSYTEQEPKGQTPTGRDYVANVVSLFLTYTM